ncbi:MAG: LysR substrate-binding domain-containing protein [Albidovulum sp.]|uniref:LysR substrate-binding domain-containing protein n=1 Tax=Albidovulum sp. TaxID=1872424 RepID=UPI003C8000AD
MNMHPPLNALKAFEAAGRHLSISRGAEELFVTPGAVSKQVKALESHLATALIKRTRDGIVLTAEGQELLGRLTASFAGLDGAVRGVRQGKVAGQVRIICMPAFASHWLIPNLSPFLARYPDIGLTVVPTGSAEDFRASDGDAAILFGRPKWPGMHVELLKQAEFFPVCSPIVLNRAGGIPKISDLADHVFLEGSSGSHWQEWFVRNGVEYPLQSQRLRFQDFNHILAAARAGLGFAMGDNVTAAPDLAAGTLVRPFRQRLRFKTDAYYIVTPTDVTLSAPARVFLGWLKAAVTEE